MQIHHHAVDNRDGWQLDLKQYIDPETIDRTRRPIVMIPGYAMNTFILAFHPGGASMVEYLVQDGFEVWTANLRGQGDSKPAGRPARYGFAEIALRDLPRVFDFIRETSEAEPDELDAIGCSLGASFLFAYLAHHAQEHGLGALVAIGGPLRWDAAHPLMKVAFRSSRIAGLFRMTGTRAVARVALPVVKRLPKLLSLYMNADMIDLDCADELVKAVDDPVPWLNRQIALWMREKDLRVAGQNVTQGLARVHDLPVLCILANADGIVPPAAALSVRDVLGVDSVSVLEVGDEVNWFAHADLFISRQAQERVFEPLRRWLASNDR
jgi:pimeloyl-ACP methyl ester carboxylesterase